MPAHVEQLYTSCMAQACYFIVSDGEAAVIDPLRDPAPYLALAAKHEARIKYVIETHFHADFVSGHQDLARETGATIVFGPTAEPNFDAHICKDGEELPLGRVKLTVLHTPGHTMESTCFLLHDESGKPTCVFTGDTLFIGDAGRPDLAQKAAHVSQEDMARLLFKSLRTKLMPLPDDVVVYPGHGAGSACGKHMSDQTSDTLGKQKLMNYTLRADMTEDEFVKELLDGLRAPPGYFGLQIAQNKGEIESVEFQRVIERGMKKLSPAEVKAAIASGVVAFDTRRLPSEFCEGHVPSSVFAGTSGSLALWVATVFRDVKQPFVLIADDETLKEGISRLARVGFDNCIGHLDGGLAAWKEAGEQLATVGTITASELVSQVEFHPETLQVLDVRGPGEWRNGHLDLARHVPLCSREPIDFKSIVDPSRPLYTHCAAGYRSVMFLSLLLRAGVEARVFNVVGGMAEIARVDALCSRITTTA